MVVVSSETFADNVSRLCAVAATYRLVVKICKFPAEYFPAKENKTSHCVKPLLAVVFIVHLKRHLPVRQFLFFLFDQMIDKTSKWLITKI